MAPKKTNSEEFTKVFFSLLEYTISGIEFVMTSKMIKENDREYIAKNIRTTSWNSKVEQRTVFAMNSLSTLKIHFLGENNRTSEK